MSERPTTSAGHDSPRNAATADVAVVVPIKSFGAAKGRLAASLSPAERADLARDMAAGVLKAAAPLPVWVVCHDHAVARWAMDHDARVMWLAGSGLNSAVTAADRFLHRIGVTRMVVAHGDLPLARELGWVAEGDGVTIVPDRRGEGTNVLALPTGSGFVFAYGDRSAGRHRAEAERLGLDVRIVSDADLGWDVDTPEDLDVFGSQEIS